MTIQAINAQAVSVPLKQSTSIATRNVSSRDYLIVDVTDSDGVVGHGYSYIGTYGASVAVQVVTELLTPSLTQQSTDSPVALWSIMYQESLLAGRRGIVLRAISALDIAFWDLRAKRAQLPLADLLGGDSTTPLPVYASGGYYRPIEGDPSEYVRREISSNIEHGFSDHKIKVGGLPVSEDAKRVAAAAEMIAGSGRLAVDANNAYRSVHEAAHAATVFHEECGGLWWFEEPFGPDQIRAHQDLGTLSPAPVATGEIHQTRWEFNELLANPGVAILQPDAGVLGGITEWLRVASLASGAGVSIAPHWHANVHAHLASAVDNCLTIEHFTLEKDIYNFEELLTPDSRLQHGDGMLKLGSQPGLGLDFDTEKLANYRSA